MLQTYALTGLFLICDRFPTKLGVLWLPEVEKLQPWNNNNVYAIAIWNYWRTMLHFQVSTMEGPKFMVSHAMAQIYVRNLSMKGYMKDYYPSYVTSLSYTIFAKVILWMAVVQNLLQIWLPKLVYHKKCVFSIFIIVTSLRLYKTF